MLHTSHAHTVYHFDKPQLPSAALLKRLISFLIKSVIVGFSSGSVPTSSICHLAPLSRH